jgi:hypothetical protein
MDQQPQDGPAARRLPGPGGPPPGHAGEARADSLRRVRRWSNWTAAALVAATAVATGYFVRASVSVPSASAPAAVIRGAVGQPGSGSAAGPRQPCISVPVATSGGSAVRAQAPVLSCGAGTGGPAAGTAVPAVITSGQWSERGDS